MQNQATPVVLQHPYRPYRVYRNWAFWGLIVLPAIAPFAWRYYIDMSLAFSLHPRIDVATLQHPDHWSEPMCHYIWLQTIWLPANVTAFLIWCALGVRLWSDRQQHLLRQQSDRPLMPHDRSSLNSETPWPR